MRLGENQIAEVSFNGQWVPICGHSFGTNDIGPSLFCQEKGFKSGKVKHKIPLQSDGLRVGQCNEGDSWLSCSGANCNQLEIGGQCNNGGKCTAGQEGAGVTIDCKGNLVL